MTGMYPQSTGLIGNGIHLRDDTPTIAEMVSDDYLCAHYGKWHLGNDLIPQHGFEEWRSIEDWHLTAGTTTRKEHRFLESDYNAWLRTHDVEPPSGQSYETWFPTAGLSAELTQAGYLGGEASRFIREHGESPHRDRPFMLFTSFFEPHPPYTGPLNGLYDPASLPVGPAFMQNPDSGSLVNRLRAEHYLSGGLNPLAVKGGDIHDTTTEEGWRKLRAQYFANVTLVDRNVGRILSALEESGQADNTIIVFTSEHGEMAGDHGMLEKRSMYEEATRVPLFIHVPWMSDEATEESRAALVSSTSCLPYSTSWAIRYPVTSMAPVSCPCFRAARHSTTTTCLCSGTATATGISAARPLTAWSPPPGVRSSPETAGS